MKKSKILSFGLVSVALLFAGTFTVNAEDAKSQNFGLNLKPTVISGSETKTENSQDLQKIWNVTFSTDNLVWNITQNKEGGSYHYVWDSTTGKYSRVTDSDGGAVTTALSDGEVASKTITITNKSNFDVTPSIEIVNGSYVDGLFTADYSSSALAYGVHADANITISEEKLGTIDTLLSESGIEGIATAENDLAYLAGTATISLTSGNIYPAEVVYSGTTSQEFLNTAASVSAGQTLKLNNNVTFDENYSVTVWEKAFNLDLNGFTIATNSGVGKELHNMGYTASAITYSVSNKNITISNGTITSAWGAGIYLDELNATLSNLNITSNTVGVQDAVEYSSAVRLTGNASATINSGNYTGKNAIAISNSGGTVVINGGTYNGDLFFSTNTDSGVSKSLTINGGTFNGDFVNFNKGTVTITGGTFTSDPTAYVASGYHVTNNANGTYTVTQNS